MSTNDVKYGSSSSALNPYDAYLPSPAAQSRTTTEDHGEYAKQNGNGNHGVAGQQPVHHIQGAEHHKQTVQTVHSIIDRIMESRGPPKSALGNPGPAGLLCFAVTLTLLSAWNTQLLPAATGNVVLPLAFWSAGILLGVTGFFELANKNTFGAGAFIAYAAFYLSYATLEEFVVPAWTAAGVSTDTQNQAIAVYLVVWTLVTFIFTIASLRTSVAIFIIFLTLEFAFIFLTAAFFLPTTSPYQNPLIKAGGWTGLACAGTGFYAAFAVLTNDTFGFQLIPIGVIGPFVRIKPEEKQEQPPVDPLLEVPGQTRRNSVENRYIEQQV